MKIYNRQVCPCCGQTINDREIAVYSGMVRALADIYRICQKTGRNQFKRSEIKPILKSGSGEGVSARFADWTMFGSMVTKAGRGNYVFNLDQLQRFFRNELQIPIAVLKRGKAKELEILRWGTIREIPNLRKFLDENMDIIVKYDSKTAQEELF